MHPAFPDRPGCKRLVLCGDHLAHRADAQKRSEEQRGHKEQKGHEPQAIRIAVRNAQVRRDQPRIPGAGFHPCDMGPPDRLRGRITPADGLLIRNRGDRTARQGRIDAGQRLGLGRQTETADAPDKGCKQRDHSDDAATPEDLERGNIVPAEHQRRQYEEYRSPERPEGAHDFLGHHPQTGGFHGQAQMAQGILLISQRSISLNVERGLPSSAPESQTNHSGSVSRAIISS